MGWPWHIIDLTKPETDARRVLLDRYGLYAQLSPIIPIALYNIYRLAKWVDSERRNAKGQYSQVPTSPSLKKHRQSQSGIFASWWRRAAWWLEGESSLGGERKFWVISVVWTVWLLFLSVYKTGDGSLKVSCFFPSISSHTLTQYTFWGTLPTFVSPKSSPNNIGTGTLIRIFLE